MYILYIYIFHTTFHTYKFSERSSSGWLLDFSHRGKVAWNLSQTGLRNHRVYPDPKGRSRCSVSGSWTQFARVLSMVMDGGTIALPWGFTEFIAETLTSQHTLYDSCQEFQFGPCTSHCWWNPALAWPVKKESFHFNNLHLLNNLQPGQSKAK